MELFAKIVNVFQALIIFASLKMFNMVLSTYLDLVCYSIPGNSVETGNETDLESDTYWLHMKSEAEYR